ncbi:MAG: nucleotide exchange factor GrpE [Oryzomonas sp.]|uniref:nucleotide exchange factor GrpE n=1 Tax=Oryzomonas sp. TaxID=2855186 RepID=UPI002850B835|nr:nucleotide exchange factor GrpE [Oryzomonas sp.]MDR3578449.1 nucleotide exchange factor GrpE [Oryzomonas sp.]
MKAHDTFEPKNTEHSAKDGGAADQAAAGALEAEPLSIEEQLAAKEKEARENWDRFLRERADLENFRKRANREKEELLNYGYKSLIEEILPVLDNLERALSHASEDGLPALVEGIRMTHGMLLTSLRKFNVTPVEAVGATFTPAFHQAMAQVPTDEYPPNTVVEEYQKGYMLKDRLLRPAMVSVSTEIKDVNS